MKMAEKKNGEARSQRSKWKRKIRQQDRGVPSAPEHAKFWRWRKWFHAATATSDLSCPSFAAKLPRPVPVQAIENIQPDFFGYVFKTAEIEVWILEVLSRPKCKVAALT